MALTKREIQEFQETLKQLRDRITQSLQLSTQEVKKPDEATGYSQHHADQGTDDFDRHISLEVTSQEFQILKQINHALERIAEGSYGKCEISGKDIPIARLKAMPYATTTVEAQEKRERGLLP